MKQTLVMELQRILRTEWCAIWRKPLFKQRFNSKCDRHAAIIGMSAESIPVNVYEKKGQ